MRPYYLSGAEIMYNIKEYVEPETATDHIAGLQS